MSIFELVNSLDIQKEYQKFNEELTDYFIWYNHRSMSYFEYLEYSGIFRTWKERDTFLYVDEYLNFIGVKNENHFKSKISQTEFLYYLEFLINIFKISTLRLQENEEIIIESLEKNIIIILNKMGYRICLDKENERIIIVRKDSDLDSVVKDMDIDLATLLIRYNDFRIQKDIFEKHSILKKIDLYIEGNKQVFKQKDKSTYDLIGKIVNNYGINHHIKIDEIKLKDEKEIINAYDDCYKLMIHLIRSVEFSKIKEKYETI